MKILLVEPKKSKLYHTPYPPLGLLKLASYHKAQGDEIEFIQGSSEAKFYPNFIYITSLFTYAYQPVHESISYYTKQYPKAQTVVGGIYATLCPDHIRETFGENIEIYPGIYDEVEDCLPDYSLIPSWDTSIIFSSRGCVRKCPFCSVPQIEPEFQAKKSIKHLIYPGHKKVILWDNNILASPFWKDIFSELEESKLIVDFNQGLDARLLTEEVVLHLTRLHIPIVRFAYDSNGIRPHLLKSIQLLKQVGIRGRKIVVYCLFNHLDTPIDFLNRLRDLMEWGVVAYPMRFEPLEPRPKNTYVSPHWTAAQLEMIAKARRVLGYGGTFPPYEGLRKKFNKAKSLEEAMELREVHEGK